MIDKEKFKEAVLSSIQFTGNGTPYLIVEDELLICPFCKNEMEKIAMKGLYCGCENSIKYSNEFYECITNLDKLNLKINEMKKSIEPLSLSYFKEFFKLKMLPDLQKEVNLVISDIENMEI
jgi:hypothetical protein